MTDKHKVMKLAGGMAVLAVVATIFYFSSQPASVSHELSDEVKHWLEGNRMIAAVVKSPWIRWISIRKLAHLLLYFLLGASVAGMMHAMNPVGDLKKKALLLCVLCAASDEIRQIFSFDRSAAVHDVLLDGVGAWMGISMMLWVIRLYQKYRKHESDEL